MKGFGRNLTEIALMLGGIATIALLVSNSKGAAELITAATEGYGGLLSIVTLQNGYGNSFANF